MSRIYWNLSDAALLILRLVAGVGMLTHGLGKLLNFGDLAPVFPDPLGLGSQISLVLAIGAEVGCSLLLLLGLFTPFAAASRLITMAVAFFIHHAQDPFSEKELSLIYLGIFATLLVGGPGKYSLDAKLFADKAPAEARS